MPHRKKITMEIIQAIEWKWTDRGRELRRRVERLDRSAKNGSKRRSAKLRRRMMRVVDRYLDCELFRIVRVTHLKRSREVA